MWKKGSLLLLAVLLLLTGCAGQASLVRDSMVASIEKPNFDFAGSFKLVGDFDKVESLVKSSGQSEAETKNALALMKTLQAGLKIEGSEFDAKHAKMTFSMNDDKILRDNNLWTGDKKAALELLLDQNSFYVTTPLDKKYLLVDPNAEQLGGTLSPEKVKEFQEKVNKLTLDFMKGYIAKYGYTLSQAKNLGEETVKLPNGDSVKATHVSIKMDLKELINMFFYTAKDATTNAEVRTFAIDLMTLFSKFQQDAAKVEKPQTEAELRAQATVMVDMGISSTKKWLEETQKTYTVDKIVEMAKAEGLEGINMTLDYYIDSNKMPVSQKVNMSVTFDPKDEKVKGPLTLGFESESFSWNFGKVNAITYPKADQVVTIEQLKKDSKAVNAFNEKGFLHAIIKEVQKAGSLETVPQ